MSAKNSGAFDEEARYDEFPPGASGPYGPSEGFNSWVQLNDEQWFNDAALANPVIQAFLSAPFTVNYAQFKSSTREAEYYVHKPHKAMRGLPGMDEDDPGIVGGVVNLPHDPHIVTLILNHENTMAKKIMRSITVQEGHVTGQVVHKEEDGDSL
ncbi:MAG: hypothetical protein ACRDGD_02600 [Candidatus Limnocylindria bacterium]